MEKSGGANISTLSQKCFQSQKGGRHTIWHLYYLLAILYSIDRYPLGKGIDAKVENGKRICSTFLVCSVYRMNRNVYKIFARMPIKSVIKTR